MEPNGDRAAQAEPSTELVYLWLILGASLGCSWVQRNFLDPSLLALSTVVLLVLSLVRFHRVDYSPPIFTGQTGNHRSRIFFIILVPLLFALFTSAPGHRFRSGQSDGQEALFLHLAFLVPFAEELYFRGLLQGFITKLSSQLPSIILSSFLFALLHLKTLHAMPFLATLLLGIVCGHLVIFFNSLFPAVVIHALWNVQVLLTNDPSIVPGNFHLQFLVFICAGIFIPLFRFTSDVQA